MEHSRGASLDADVLTRKAKDRFLRDPEFRRIAAARWIEEMTPTVIAQALHRARTPSDIPAGLSPEEYERRVKAKIDAFYESLGDGKAKRLIKMRRPELTFVVASREKQVAGELRIIAFEKALLRKLPDDYTTVEHATDERERFALWVKHLGRKE